MGDAPGLYGFENGHKAFAQARKAVDGRRAGAVGPPVAIDDTVKYQRGELGGENLLPDARQSFAEFGEGVRAVGEKEQKTRLPFAGDHLEHGFDGAGIEGIAFTDVRHGLLLFMKRVGDVVTIFCVLLGVRVADRMVANPKEMCCEPVRYDLLFRYCHGAVGNWAVSAADRSCFG
jgi:hypothetical protein